MSDVSPAAPDPAPAKEPIFNPPSKWRRFWEDMDVLKALALAAVLSYIAVATLPGFQQDETHRALALIAMNYYFGSSKGSRDKDDKVKPPSS